MSTFELSGPATTLQSGNSSLQRAADPRSPRRRPGLASRLHVVQRTHDLLVERVGQIERAHHGIGLVDQGQWPVAARAHCREKPPLGPGHHVMR